MNLKERGFTVGDLIIILIITISTIFIINKAKDSYEQSYLHLYSSLASASIISYLL